MGAKDFGPIENDYAFFSTQSTEPENDAAEYTRRLAGFADGRTLIRMLDFGGGTGAFTHRFLSAVNWPPRLLALTLVEPVAHQREEAARRLAPFTERPVATAGSLPPNTESRFDLALSNHALYYVENLDETLRSLVRSLAPGGVLLLAIAGWDNPLLGLWKTGFALLGRPVPYYSAEDVEAALTRQGVAFEKTPVPYRLRFPDSAENRLKILRFLFANHLAEITPERLLGEFDRHVKQDHVDIETGSSHFTVRRSA